MSLNERGNPIQKGAIRWCVLALFVVRLCAQLPPNPFVSALVNSASCSVTIGPNAWVTIYRENLALPGDVRPWTASDFTNNQLPTSLDGVSVKFFKRRARIRFIYKPEPYKHSHTRRPDAVIAI